MNQAVTSHATVRWGVVATVSEPAPLIAAFVAHHLNIGAHRVTLHLDQPDPQIENLLSGIEKCQLIHSNSEWWKSETTDGVRPKDHRVRQKINANATLRTSNLDWLLHLDADEFLEADVNISHELGKLHSDCDAAHVSNRERVFFGGTTQKHLFEGYSRRPFHRRSRLGNILYGKDYVQFLNHGMAGHKNGKTFVRTEREVGLDIHHATNSKKTVNLQNVLVTHFDGMTRLHWISKIYSKTLTSLDLPNHKRSASRRSLIDFAAGPGIVRKQMEQMFENIMSLTPYQAVAMKLLGLVRPISIDPTKAARRLLGETSPDFSCENFDCHILSKRWPVTYRKAVLHVSLLDNFTERLIALQGACREETEIEHLVKTLSTRNITIIDVGANVGLYSVVLGLVVSPESRIIAVECSPEALNRLKTNLNTNHLEQVEVLEAAISDKRGTAKLNFVAEDNLGEATLETSPQEVRSTAVEALTLLDALDRYNIEKADFIKLDIEGHELAVIQKFMKDAPPERWPSRMLLEMKHNDVSAHMLHTLLQDKGYVIELQTKNNTIYKYGNVEV